MRFLFGMRKEGAKPDLVVARIAGRQHGVVSFGQLVAAGLTPPGITRRVQAGWLHRLHRGVYAVGHLKLRIEARWMARTLRDLSYDDEPTRSDLERAFLRLCRQRGVPKPQVNARVGRYRVDFLWPDAALIVETDGYRYHSGRKAFEEDRRRDRELRRLGFTVLRFTYRDVTEDAAAVIGALRAHLYPPSRTSLTA